MSGIVGLVNLDGTPVDRQLLGRMTAFLAFRGPDVQQSWVDGPVGLGHALLRTTWESEAEQQPCSLDGQVWITADARIDDRANLVARLAGLGRQATPELPDAELILHAYHAWGDRCVEHLLGDFAFAIWDGRQRRLFCARDHFGVKPFYYAQGAGSLVFSNTLNCVRLHPAVSDRLNDQAIGDFLLFGWNEDRETTAFADIHRLPPAHTLDWQDERLRLKCYWSLPVAEQVRYRRPADYVAHFNEVFRAAIADRLRTDRVNVCMSGGMDSCSVAATARALAVSGSRPVDLKGQSFVFDRLIPDQERRYAGLAAAALGIPIRFQVADDYQLFERWDEPELHRPEPCEGAASGALVADHYRACAAHGRVALTGEGGDSLQYGSATYALNLLKKARWGCLAADCWMSLRCGRLPRVGLRSALRRWLGTRVPWQFPYPEWLDDGFAARLGLESRLNAVNCGQPLPHPNRPEACRVLLSAMLVSWFESFDPGTTGCALELRHPYCDLRVVNFFLSIPPVPWCTEKELVRRAMRGILPETIRLRPKTLLAGEPARELLRQGASRWVDRFVATEELRHYVNRSAIPPLAGETDMGRIWTHLRPLCLQFWLRNRNAFRRTSSRKDHSHGIARADHPQEALPRA